MNKTELISIIAEKTDMPKKDTDTMLNATLDTIMETVASGEKISLVGFGTFEKKIRAARVGHNPKTGESMSIPESTAPKFHAGKVFKESCK
jgi:DNA-binding protein HU-beta